MTTQHRENYGRDVRNFHHPEDDMRPAPDPQDSGLENESYIDQYLQGDDQEEIVNQDDDIVNNEDHDEVNNRFAGSSGNYPEENYLNENDPEDEDIDPGDIDDDLIERYDENDRDINDYSTDQLDVAYDIDQDLEETDPVGNPRKFDY